MTLLNPYALLGALVAVIALVGGGYQWGATATDNAWAAKQAKVEKAAQAALEAERQRGDEAAGNYLRNHLDQEDRYDQLAATHDDLLRRHPFVVARPVAGMAACAPPPRAAAPVGVATAPEPAPSAPPDAVAGDLDLTLAAVRVWNNALTGTDRAAGACGAAGTAENADAACSESAGLTLRDAWNNHAANAKSCAADRQRHRALIDFLNGK